MALTIQDLDFEVFKVKLLSDHNDLELAGQVRSDLANYLINFQYFFSQLKSQDTDTISKDDLTYIGEQLDLLLEHFLTTFSNVSQINHLSQEINVLIAKNYTNLLSLMLQTAHPKFNLKLIDFVNKFSNLICSNIKKLSMKSNWYSSIKHMSLVILQFIFNKFSGFLNSTKNELLTCSYKHLMKIYDNYNSSVENSIFKANYFTDLLKLIDIIVTNDNNSHALDSKLYGRLLKISKYITSSKTKPLSASSSASPNSLSSNSSSPPTSGSSQQYTYPLLCVIHSNNILVALLKSDRYLASITTKKSAHNLSNYLTSLSTIIANNFVQGFNTDSKKLRLHLSKNLSDLLVFNFIVYGSNQNEANKLLTINLDFLLSNYITSPNLRVRSGLLETMIQFLSTINIYYQTNKIQSGSKHGVTFVSLQIFKILDIINYKMFGVRSLNIEIELEMGLFKEKDLEETKPGFINANSNFNEAITILNQLEILYSFLIKEIDSDINKLILLGKLSLDSSSNSNKHSYFKSLKEFVPNENTSVENQWFILTNLKLIQMLIVDLGEYVLSYQSAVSGNGFAAEDIATQISQVLFTLSKHQDFQIRVLSIETLVKLLNIKPELCFEILNESLTTLLRNLDDIDGDKRGVFAFTVNHGLSFLISSIMTHCPKDYISTDFTLKVFSTTNYLKKFNSTVIQTNLFGSSSKSNSIISNVDYEKQLLSWILLMGLFNFAADDNKTTDVNASYHHNDMNDHESKNNNDFFLLGNSQFMNIWKGLLAHSIPSNFVQIEKQKKSGSGKSSSTSNSSGYANILNLGELMKLIEIKNHSLVCLLSYITYMTSTKSTSVVQTHDSSGQTASLLTPEIARQLNQILGKSFTFINSIKSQVLASDYAIPPVLANNIKFNKLRIYQASIKLMPYLNVKNDINSSLLIEIVNNFSDFQIYNYPFKSDPNLNKASSSKKKIDESLVLEDKDLFYLNDGLSYGLTSKVSQYKIEELLIKSTGLKSSLVGNASSNENSNIDQIASSHNSASLSVESPYIKSTLVPVTVFDETFESMIDQPIQHSFFNDYLITLYNGNNDVGYTDSYQYAVNKDTMLIDISIELFAISFPHLTLKIQQSIIETMRSSILAKLGEIPSLLSISKEIENYGESSSSKKYKGDFFRKKALTINCIVAFHSLLNYMNNHNQKNGNSMKHSHLRLPKVVGSWIIETIKSSNMSNSFLTSLNAESIGLCASLIEEEHKEEVLSVQMTSTIKSIIDNTNPLSRSFGLQSLAHIDAASNLTNSGQFLNILFSLIVDPHPIVHIAALDSLTALLLRKSQMELNESLLYKIIKSLDNIWLSDDFGIKSPITLASNMNFDAGNNSVVGIARLIRVILNNLGPAIVSLDEDIKQSFKHLLYSLVSTTTANFELISRELIKTMDGIVLFDKSFFSVDDYSRFMKFTLLNNFKVGIDSGCITEFPFAKEDNDTSSEMFPISTSFRNLQFSINSLLQLMRLSSNGKDIITADVEKLIWIALDINPYKNSCEKILMYLLELTFTSSTTSIEEKCQWFDKLVDLFSVSKNVLHKELFDILEIRIDNGGKFFGKQYSQVGTSNTSNQLASQTAAMSSVTSQPSNREPVSSDEEDGEGETFNTAGNDDEGQHHRGAEGSSEGRLPRLNEANSGKSGAEEFVKLMVVENEPVSWKFKVFTVELLLVYLDFSRSDSRVHSYLAKKIPEIIRLTLLCSTSSIASLRLKSLELLESILDIFSETKDPLYPDSFLLEQQQAQIITAIVPAFSKESNLELANKAIVLASAIAGSHITSVTRMTRITKLLSTTLEDFASVRSEQSETISSAIRADELTENESSSSNTALKIGEVPVLTLKSQNRIQLSVLHAWAKLVVKEVDPDGELHQLVIKYIDILIPLWLYVLRDFAMIKYGGSFMSGNGNQLEMVRYEEAWLEIVEAISIAIERDYVKLDNLLRNDKDNFFFVLFGQCIETLIKASSKSRTVDFEVEKTILTVLKRILSLDLSSSMLFRDSIFIEFIDLMDRLVMVSDASIKTKVMELSSVVFKNYFSHSTVNKSEEESHSDFDKLFELLRINMLIVNQILPFIRDGEINIDKVAAIHGPQLALLKKCYDSMFDMIGNLPDIIKSDFFACCLYQFSLIYQLRNGDVISVLLPTLKKILAYFSTADKGSKLVNDFYNTIMQYVKNEKSHKDSLLTIYVMITTCNDSLILSEEECDYVASGIIDGLISKENLLTIAIQTIKTLMGSVSSEGTSSTIIQKLLPKLIKLLTNSLHRLNGDDLEEPDYYLDEPRLILEMFVLFTKSLTDDEQILQSLNITIPILCWFDATMNDLDSSDLRPREYVHGKLVELITFKHEIFKSLIASVSDSQRTNIESLVKFDFSSASSTLEVGGNSTGEGHIQLKMFG